MSLQATGEVTVEVDRATAFQFARDAQKMAQCIPGCHDLKELSANSFAAILTNKVAFITLSFNVVVELAKVDVPSKIEATVTGEPIRLSGRLVAKAGMEFAEAGEKRTLIRYSAEVGLTGKLGGLGQPVLKAKSVELGRQFATNLKAAIEKEALNPTPLEAHA